MEMIAMSTRDRRRTGLMTRVAEGVLKLRVAGEMMRVTYGVDPVDLRVSLLPMVHGESAPSKPPLVTRLARPALPP